jgi:hypothetical protein
MSFATAVRHLPIASDQEDLQFQMESKASMPRSNTSHINLAQLWYRAKVYPKYMY